jgi:hypothetical protein
MAGIQDYIKKMLDAAKPRQRQNLELGNYVFTIAKMTHERREKREKLGKAFWIDVVVAEAESAKDGAVPTPVGTRLDFPFVLEGQYADFSFKDMKEFLVSLTGCADEDASKKWDELVEMVTDEGVHTNTRQLARGMQIVATTRSRVTKSGQNAGKERVYPIWHHLEGQTSEEIAARRAELDAADAKK